MIAKKFNVSDVDAAWRALREAKEETRRLWAGVKKGGDATAWRWAMERERDASGYAWYVWQATQ